MQHRRPQNFQRKFKRFFSYSMTPYDMEFEQISEFPMGPSSTSKILNTDFQQLTSMDTKYLNFRKNNGDISSSVRDDRKSNAYNITKQNSNTQNLSESIEFNFSSKISSFSSQKNKRLITSEMFSSIGQSQQKIQNIKIKPMKTSTFWANKIKKDNDFQRNSIVTSQRKENNTKVPAFILNRKKENNVSKSQSKQADHADIKQSLQNGIKTKPTLRKMSFKKQPSSSTEWQDSNLSLFSPPSISKISFSKATASTIHTQLQPQISKQKLEPFDDFQEVKKNKTQSMSINRNLFDSLIAAHNKINNQHTSHQTCQLEDQFMELFGHQQQQDVDHQYDQKLEKQLEGLF